MEQGLAGSRAVEDRTSQPLSPKCSNLGVVVCLLIFTVVWAVLSSLASCEERHLG